MMDGASGVCADLMDSADFAAFGDDGLGGEFADLVLGPLGFVFRFWLVVPNRGVLIAGQNGAAVLLPAVGRADLQQFRLRGNTRRNVCLNLGLIAGGVGAAVPLLA